MYSSSVLLCVVHDVAGSIGLGYFVKQRGFSAEVIEMVEELVPLTRLLWQQTKVLTREFTSR